MIAPFCIIQARSDSQRLPQKMGLTLQGKTLLTRAWEQASSIFGADNVVIATHYADLGIVPLIPSTAQHFIGIVPPDDVLGRFWQCVDRYNAFDRQIIRWTPDDWRKDSDMVRQAVGGDLTAPVEASIEYFSGAELNRWHWKVISKRREHIGLLLPPRPVAPADALPWSIDTQKDYNLVVAAVGA